MSAAVGVLHVTDPPFHREGRHPSFEPKPHRQRAGSENAGFEPQDSSGKGAESHAAEEGPRSPTPLAGGPDAQAPGLAAPSPEPPPSLDAALMEKVRQITERVSQAAE